MKVGRCTLFRQPRSPFYNMRVMVRGRRRQFSTGESTQAKATDKARAILADLKSRGLVETIALHSRRVDEVPVDPTLDEFSDLSQTVMAAADYPPAFQTRARYIKSLKLIGSAVRTNRVRALTPEKIKKFMANYQVGSAEAGRQSASIKTSLNSILRNSAALFSKAALAGYSDHGLSLVNPFAGLKLRRVEIKGFSPLQPDILRTIWKNAALLRDGDPGAKEPPKLELKTGAAANTCPICGGPIPKKRPSGPAKEYCSIKCSNRARWTEPDWRKPHPEAYMLLLLELGLGLRRHESDKAQKDWFLTDTQGRRYLEVRTTPFFMPKSKERRVIPVADVLYEALKPYFRESDSFIVPGRQPKVYTAKDRPKNLVYRCDRHHRTLAAWLRLQGVSDAKPCHVLRKQFGSYVATTFGLYHAQKFLGHSSPKVTSDYYAGLTELPEINNLQIEAPKTQ